MVDDILKHPPHDNLTEAQWRIHELTIIRAFVERVEKRLPDYDTGRGADAMLKAYRQAVYDELAAMEETE
jgi:uncharacterized protein YktA (UPF0223 family)